MNEAIQKDFAEFVRNGCVSCKKLISKKYYKFTHNQISLDCPECHNLSMIGYDEELAKMAKELRETMDLNSVSSLVL